MVCAIITLSYSQYAIYTESRKKQGLLRLAACLFKKIVQSIAEQWNPVGIPLLRNGPPPVTGGLLVLR
jgi:hypothetical protein